MKRVASVNTPRRIWHSPPTASTKVSVIQEIVFVNGEVNA